MAYLTKKFKQINGTVSVPADKSVSHRAIIFSSLCKGKVVINNLLESEDVFCTIQAFKKMGVKITKQDNKYIVVSKGIHNLTNPKDVLYMGNSGTTTRLMLGILSNLNFNVVLNGDKSLNNRPMDRVIDPLQKTGARFVYSDDKKLPLMVANSQKKQSKILEYTLPIPSAQVKSSLLLAGLKHAKQVTIHEPIATRAYTEQFLKMVNANIKSTLNADKSFTHVIKPLKQNQELSMPTTLTIPADPSSASFLCVACLILPNSAITIKQVDISHTRIGLYKTLIKMGANIKFVNHSNIGGLEVADLQVKSSKLNAIDVAESKIPSQVDEIPILSVACSFAQGTTNIYGLKELTVKESNRLQGTYDLLNNAGIICSVGNNYSLHITGSNKVKGGSVVNTNLDHRMAMSAYVLGMVSEKPITIDDTEAIKTSFPNFFDIFNNMCEI